VFAGKDRVVAGSSDCADMPLPAGVQLSSIGHDRLTRTTLAEQLAEQIVL
jgi:hypothetical protein